MRTPSGGAARRVLRRTIINKLLWICDAVAGAHGSWRYPRADNCVRMHCMPSRTRNSLQYAAAHSVGE